MLEQLGVTYPTLFEANCEVHVQLWLSCTRDRRLNVPSEGRNSLWFIYPTLNGPWGRAAVWIWSTDVANQFQTFFPAVKNPSKVAPTGIWTRDLQNVLHQKREFEPLCHTLPINHTLRCCLTTANFKAMIDNIVANRSSFYWPNY